MKIFTKIFMQDRNRGSYWLSSGKPAGCRNFHVCSRNTPDIYAAYRYKSRKPVFSLSLPLSLYLACSHAYQDGSNIRAYFSDPFQHLHSIDFSSRCDLAFQSAFQDLSAYVREKTESKGNLEEYPDRIKIKVRKVKDNSAFNSRVGLLNF